MPWMKVKGLFLRIDFFEIHLFSKKMRKVEDIEEMTTQFNTGKKNYSQDQKNTWSYKQALKNGEIERR